MLSERQAGDCRCAKLMKALSEIARLEAEGEWKDRRIASLEAQLGKARRTALEQPFGLSTPSSKRLVKRYTLHVRYCPHCMKPVRTRVPGVMENCRYANSVIARAATEFYFHGIPAGVVARMSAVGKQTLFGIFNRVAEILRPARESLLDRIRSADFAQGDETGWRIDGMNGYAWVFISGNPGPVAASAPETARRRDAGTVPARSERTGAVWCEAATKVAPGPEEPTVARKHFCGTDVISTPGGNGRVLGTRVEIMSAGTRKMRVGRAVGPQGQDTPDR